MNIPSGVKLVINLNLRETNIKKMIEDLQKKQFTGYITVTTKQDHGFEDGIIVIKKGIISGSYYNILSNHCEIYSKDALALIENAFGSDYGIIDIYQLTNEQLDLMLTFNEKIRLENKEYKLNLDLKYDKQKLQRYLNTGVDSSKYDLLKKIGLEGLKI